MQAQYKGQYSGLPNRRWGVGIPRLLHMAWYPSGHKGLDLKSCVSASIWLVGSNPTHAAASQRSLHVAMLFSLILYICSVGQAAKTWDFQSQNRVSITLRSTIWPCGRIGRVTALSRRSFAGSYPARVTIIWRISSEEQNASLSRWRPRVQVPYTSPPIQNLASY